MLGNETAFIKGQEFIAQTVLFIAQNEVLSLILTIYRSEPLIYRSNAFQSQVNLVRQQAAVVIA